MLILKKQSSLCWGDCWLWRIFKSKAIIEVDEYFVQSGMLFIETGEAGVGKLQRHFSIGFNRARRIIDQLQESGVISHAECGESIKILMTKKQFEEYLKNVEITIAENSIPKYEINNEEERIHMYNDKFDYMTGEDFEEFIANILKKIGFYNIQLTKKSGDQGVDILAEKQGIKHAIQCKRKRCYALGQKSIKRIVWYIRRRGYSYSFLKIYRTVIESCWCKHGAEYFQPCKIP